MIYFFRKPCPAKMRRKRRRERRRRQKLTENRSLSNNTRLWSRSMSHFSEVSMARSDNDSDDSRRKSKKKKSKRWDLLGWTIINSNFCMWWGTVRQINKSNIEHLVSRNYKPLYKRRIFFLHNSKLWQVEVKVAEKIEIRGATQETVPGKVIRKV